MQVIYNVLSQFGIALAALISVQLFTKIFQASQANQSTDKLTVIELLQTIIPTLHKSIACIMNIVNLNLFQELNAA